MQRQYEAASHVLLVVEDRLRDSSSQDNESLPTSPLPPLVRQEADTVESAAEEAPEISYSFFLPGRDEPFRFTSASERDHSFVTWDSSEDEWETLSISSIRAPDSVGPSHVSDSDSHTSTSAQASHMDLVAAWRPSVVARVPQSSMVTLNKRKRLEASIRK